MACWALGSTVKRLGLSPREGGLPPRLTARGLSHGSQRQTLAGGAAPCLSPQEGRLATVPVPPASSHPSGGPRGDRCHI